MYYNQPVMIPDVPGKIVYRKKGDSTYVQFETGRTYSPETQDTRVERCIVGIQIPRKPELMLPNDNYFKHFQTDIRAVIEEKQGEIQAFARKSAQLEKIRDDFDHMYYDFQTVSRGRWNEVVSPDTVTMINGILAPVIEILEKEEDRNEGQTPEPGERNGARLGLIPDPIEKDIEGMKGYEGKTFEYVNFLLGQFKGAIGRFFQKNSR